MNLLGKYMTIVMKKIKLIEIWLILMICLTNKNRNRNIIFHIFYMQYSHAKTDIITMAKISVFFVIKRRHIFFCSKQKSILRLTFFVSKLYIAFKIFSSIHLYLQFLAFLFFSYLGVCHIHKTGINLPSRRMYSV